MMEARNPQAFPSQGRLRDNYKQRVKVITNEGMTLRDYFAGAVISSQKDAVTHLDKETMCRMAVSAYNLADAMLEAREGE
jgi:hypothetical protein